MSDCDIPNKCPFCGEHTWCENSRTFKRLPRIKEQEEIIEIDEDGKVVSGNEQLEALKRPFWKRLVSHVTGR
jgi:hypothetical protein